MKPTLPAAVLVLLPCLASTAAAEGKTEVSLLAGVSLLDVTHETRLGTRQPQVFPVGPNGPIPAVEIRVRQRLGGSFVQALRVARFLGSRAAIEAGLAIAPGHDLQRDEFVSCDPPGPLCPRSPAGPALPDRRTTARVTAYHYDVGATYELLGGGVRPFLGVSLGGVSNDAPEGTATDFALGLSAGARLSFAGRVGMRLEVQDRLIPDHFISGRLEHDLHVRAGLAFRLP